jgi:rare lipoprotein A (peptidoglycan hydrolase)
MRLMKNLRLSSGPRKLWVRSAQIGIGCAILVSLGMASTHTPLSAFTLKMRGNTGPGTEKLNQPQQLVPQAKAAQPEQKKPFKLFGTATWYGSVLQGHHTASGERFDMYRLTAAHRFLPFGSLVRVKNLRNGRSVVVRVNDRGEFQQDRIDLSYAAAQQLKMIKCGVTEVELEVLNPKPASNLVAKNRIVPALQPQLAMR